MKILIDHRENKSKSFKKIINNINLSNNSIFYEVTELKVGDYIIGNICIERKTVSDYISSLIDGRLSTQLYNISRNYKISYLVIIGNIDNVEINERLSKKAFISSIIGASIKVAPDGEMANINLIMLESEEDFVEFIELIIQKSNNSEPRLPTLNNKKLSKNEELINIVSSISGIGENKAKLILEKYNTIQKIANLTPDELMKIKGIGPKLSKKIVETFNRTYKNKDEDNINNNNNNNIKKDIQTKLD